MLQSLLRFFRVALVVALIAGANAPAPLRALSPDWWKRRPAGSLSGLSERPQWLSSDAYSRDFIEFLCEVQRRTEHGSRVLVLLPAPIDQSIYWYARHRVNYLLAGRLVAEPADASSPLFAQADYIAAWRPAFSPPAAPLILETHGGRLYRGAAKR